MKEQHERVLLRKALPADLTGITAVEELSFVHAGERFDHDRVAYLIVNPRSIVTVAMREDQLLGWASGIVWLRGREPWGRIYSLAVHPQARGQRLGQRLMNDMIASLRARGAGRIFLEVRVDNHPAIRMYESAGFSTCRLLHNYYGKDLAGQRMELGENPN